nr:MAG TPA: excisionase [Caudoviricetes sp.]
MDTKERWCVTIAEAAKRADLSEAWLRETAETDKTFPAFRPAPGKTLVPVTSFIKWLERQADSRAGMPTTPATILQLRKNRKRKAAARRPKIVDMEGERAQ